MKWLREQIHRLETGWSTGSFYGERESISGQAQCRAFRKVLEIEVTELNDVDSE